MMWYLAEQIIWLLIVAFLVGIFVGWITSGQTEA